MLLRRGSVAGEAGEYVKSPLRAESGPEGMNGAASLATPPGPARGWARPTSASGRARWSGSTSATHGVGPNPIYAGRSRGGARPSASRSR